MAELHGELNSHFDLHKKALTVAPNSGRAAGEFWAAVLEPDKDVSNLNSEDFHWFKVKGKHTVAKVQKAYHKQCVVTILFRQGDRVIPLTTQMQQINHFKDDIIIFSTSIISEEDDADLSRMQLQSIDAASQNRMQTPSQTPVKAETDPVSGPVKIKAERDLSTVSPSPFEAPAISRTLPDAVQFGTPALGQLDTPAPAPTSGFHVFAESQGDYHRHSKLTAAGLENSLRKAWTVLTPASREFWERKASKEANDTTAPVNAPAPNELSGYESFAEVHRESYTSSSATPAEIESSLRKVWDRMSNDTREYYLTKYAQKSNAPMSSNSSSLSAPPVDTKPLPGSFSPSANNRSESVTEDDIAMKPDDYSSAFKDEDSSPEPELQPQTLEFAKLRLQHIMEEGSAEVLEEEVKKTNDFLNTLKNHFRVPEAESHPDTTHWLQQIDTLQAQVVNTPTIIGVIGNTGAGKSSIINAMLDEERLVPTNCMRACTAVVTEMSWNFCDDPSKKYRAEIEFIKECDWEKDLKVSLNELIDASGNASRDSTNADTEAGIAYAKIKAVYPNKTHEMLAKSTAEELLAEGDVRTVLGTTRTIEKSSPEFFYKELQRYVDSKEKSTGEKGRPGEKKKEKRTMEFWPLIKVVRIFVKADALSTGAVIVDLPGVHDSNAARAAVAAGYMKQCTGLWICAPINRAVDDKAAKSLLGESFKRQLKYDGQFSRITFICSKTDDISVLEASDSLGLENAMAEDYAMIDQIDKQLDELNAKIANLKENIDVYSGVYNDADESLDIWDDLRRDLDAGEAVYAPKARPEKSPKRKRSPSSSKSRKKMKISRNDEDDDDDFIDDDDDDDHDDQEDDEISDDETEAEDLDRGDPLTIEDIEQKIDDLKDTKKQARKEKVALELEIKEVKRQSKELDQQRKEIDTRMRAICIDGRNEYSKGAIQQDFAAGIKELDMENAEEEDAENFNPDEDIRDYDAVARSLPVFCVSSRAYQQLNGRLRKDAKIPGFRNVQETQIPQLQAHCKKLTEAGRSATYRRFLNSLLQLVLSLSLWSNNDGTNVNLSDSQKAAQASWLEKKFKELEESLDEAVESCVADMKDALIENIFEKFSEAIPLAAEQAPRIAAKWGAPVNKADRAAGGLYFQTYRAVIRRDGVYGNKNGAYNFNGDLIEPIMKHLANHWEKNFSRRIPSVLRSFTTKTNLILKNFHQAVESRSRKNGTGIAGLEMLSQQLRTYESSFSILNIEMIEAINNLQRDANREFVPVIAQNLASSYQHCAGESGVGTYKRIKDHLGDQIDQKRNSMFKESCDEVKTRLNKMCRQVEESMNNKTDEVFLLMRRDYLQVLNGAQLNGEVMSKWERHVRSEIARALSIFEQGEAEKIATGVKDEEDESAEAGAVQDNGVEVDAMGLDEAEAPTVKNEQFTDNGAGETDTNAKSSVMDFDDPAAKASPSDSASTDIPA